MNTLFYINYTCIFIVYTFCQHFKFPPKCMYYNVTPYSRICISITIAIGLIQIIWSPPGCASDVAFLLIDLSWEISRFILCQIVFFFHTVTFKAITGLASVSTSLPKSSHILRRSFIPFHFCYQDLALTCCLQFLSPCEL